MAILKYSEMPVVQIHEGAERRLGQTDNLMIVVVDLYDGPQAQPDPPHSHPHEQVVNILEGELELTLAGKPEKIRPRHGGSGLEAPLTEVARPRAKEHPHA